MVLAFVLLGAFPPKVEFFPSNEPQYSEHFHHQTHWNGH